MNHPMTANHITRRAALVSAITAAASAQIPSDDMEREFAGLVTEFLLAWNEVSSCILRHVSDAKRCAAFEQAYERMTSHPGWVSMRRRKK